MATTLYQTLRRNIAEATGEAQSQNDWVDAGIALAVARTALERHFRGIEVSVPGLGVVPGDVYVRQVLSEPAAQQR